MVKTLKPFPVPPMSDEDWAAYEYHMKTRPFKPSIPSRGSVETANALRDFFAENFKNGTVFEVLGEQVMVVDWQFGASRKWPIGAIVAHKAPGGGLGKTTLDARTLLAMHGYAHPYDKPKDEVK